MYYPTSAALKGNVDAAAEGTTVLATYVNWMKDSYKKNRKEAEEKKQSMRDALLFGSAVEVNEIESEETDIGNLVNDNIVFYLCGSMINKRKKSSCRTCLETLEGSRNLPLNLTVEKLTICKDEGHLNYCSKNMFDMISVVERAFLVSVKESRIFLRDSFEEVLRNVDFDALPTVGCISHQVEFMTDLIMDYVVRRFTCLAEKKNAELTAKSHKSSQSSRKLAKVITPTYVCGVF